LGQGCLEGILCSSQHLCPCPFTQGVGDGTAGVGDGTARVGDGTAGVGDGTARVGDGTAGVGDGTAGVGDGTAVARGSAGPLSQLASELQRPVNLKNRETQPLEWNTGCIDSRQKGLKGDASNPFARF
jgi:hypothetical protein